MLFEKLYDRLSTLPVVAVAEDVALSVYSGVATVLASNTGSGKTLYVSSYLAGFVDELVVVLVPRRFLAVNAAETVAELAECEVGGCVGYAVGKQAGDKSNHGSSTRLLYATYGYALASGLVWSAKVVVLDEVHEASMDMSIVRALLHMRRARGEDVKILEMSATINAERHAKYWGEAEVLQTEGATFPCERRHRPASRVEDEVMELIREGRRGILVFRPGMGEVEETAEEIRKLATTYEGVVEIAVIYGSMSYAERAEAVKPPSEGCVKVLVGTNVVESGVNIPWLDAGVTCGTGKENNVRPLTGATYLALENLPQWRLQQQEGRVKRFRPGIFVLCAPLSFEQRSVETKPEIVRLALTQLVMHCAVFGLRAHDLVFDHPLQADKVAEAEMRLQHLGLIDQDCMLTKAGRFVNELPVGPETGAMLWHASNTGCLQEMLVQAAVIEVGGVRKDFRFGHGLNQDSDYLDGLYAFICAIESRGNRSYSRREVFDNLNIGFKKFTAATDLLEDLERRLQISANLRVERKESAIRQCILAGSLDRLFFGGVMLKPVQDAYCVYSIGQGSCVEYVREGEFVVGELRVITPRDKRKPPFTIVQDITRMTLWDIVEVTRHNPGQLQVEESEDGFGGKTVTYKLFGRVIAQKCVEKLPETPYPLEFEYSF